MYRAGSCGPCQWSAATDDPNPLACRDIAASKASSISARFRGCRRAFNVAMTIEGSFFFFLDGPTISRGFLYGRRAFGTGQTPAAGPSEGSAASPGQVKDILKGRVFSGRP